MSDPVAAPTSFDPLPPMERRVLGVLIEKQKTSKSPDAYPMTLNSIMVGCNQKSNRDPVYDLDEVDVEETLVALQKKSIVMKMTGSRVDRWRHLLYETWKVTKVEMAILAELLLRGPQTEGDLRGRASRMEDIADLDELRTLLKSLGERNLIVYVTEPNRRGSIVTHGFHEPEELERERERFSGSAVADSHSPSVTPRVSSASSGNASTSAIESRLTEALDEIAKLKERVARLEALLN